MSLGLNDDTAVAAPAAPRHKSAGLAFGLSALIPGAGQLYCGKVARGAMTFGFWLLGLVLVFSSLPVLLKGQALFVMVVLWIFSFLDAYYTAIEINRGQDDVVDEQNPRLAVTLNLLTAGFGYFYLGDRTKGIALFVVMQVMRLLLPSTGVAGMMVSLVVITVQIAAAFDAHRIARKQITEESASLAGEAAPETGPGSRLPAVVPIVFAVFVSVGFIVLGVAALIVKEYRAQKSRLPAVSKVTRRPWTPSSRYSPPPANSGPIHAVDMFSAVQDVQRVHRKASRTKEDIPYLRQDVAMLGSVADWAHIVTADVVVARYYRALGLVLINTAHEREGEPVDVPAAHTALADFDKIISGSSLGTYAPEVSITNAEYWAGFVERNHLRQPQEAKAYWEKCAWQTHAGCMYSLAAARITGDDGEKVDLQEALKLYAAAYNSGMKYPCSGALSAMGIANINYFEGVRRPGDDELEWTKKANALLDKVDTAGDRNGCNRANIDVDEFLLQLSHGHRDDNILQDAVSRLDEGPKSTRAVIQFISGAIDEAGFESVVQSDKWPGARCSAYFDAMWYAELRNEQALARRYYQRLVEIGEFHCGEHLRFARKFKFSHMTLRGSRLPLRHIIVKSMRLSPPKGNYPWIIY